LTRVLGKLNGRLAELEESYSAETVSAAAAGNATDEPGGKRGRRKD
jgi:hypothetical protein